MLNLEILRRSSDSFIDELRSRGRSAMRESLARLFTGYYRADVTRGAISLNKGLVNEVGVCKNIVGRNCREDHPPNSQ